MSNPGIDLLAPGLLPPLPRAFLAGESLDLLEPLSFVHELEVGDAPGPSPDRSVLGQALAVANAAYGHPGAERLARKLADPRTRVVVTGQQPGLLGGPLYTLSKAVAASLWADRLEARGESAVAVFWVATEDHDYREVANAVVLGPNGAQRLDLGDDDSPLTPVGMRTLGPNLEPLLDEVRALQPGDRWADWIERLASWYRPDARFGEAFSRLIVGLLGERSPLMLDSMLPELKEAQRPWLRRLVEERVEIETACTTREGLIRERGFDLQIKPSTGASPLFFLHGRARRRIEWRGDESFGLRGEEGFSKPVGWLLEVIEENPAAVSAGVKARTAIQDATLGTSVLVLGPGEVSYMPQVAPGYALFGIPAPAIALRPQILVVPEHQLGKLPELGVTLGDLIAPDLDADRLLAGGREDELVGPVRDELKRQLERLREGAISVDPNLASPFEKTENQMTRALDAFAGRLAASVARANESKHRRLRTLRDLCRPLGVLQERALSTAHFPGKYGDDFVAALFDQMELDPSRVHVVSP